MCRKKKYSGQYLAIIPRDLGCPGKQISWSFGPQGMTYSSVRCTAWHNTYNLTKACCSSPMSCSTVFLGCLMHIAIGWSIDSVCYGCTKDFSIRLTGPSLEGCDLDIAYQCCWVPMYFDLQHKDSLFWVRPRRDLNFNAESSCESPMLFLQESIRSLHCCTSKSRQKEKKMVSLFPLLVFDCTVDECS